jgi:hypothetical protein
LRMSTQPIPVNRPQRIMTMLRRNDEQ